MSDIRNRVQGLEWLDPKEVLESPHNWRLHDENQKLAFAAVLESVGFAGALLCYRNGEGKAVLIDGHLRREVMVAEKKVPVLMLDITEDEARTLLATYDPLSQMAIRDDSAFAKLLETIDSDIARLFAIDLKDGERAGGGQAEEPAKGKYEVVPNWDEAYDGVLIVTVSAQEYAQVATALSLGRRADRRGRLGTTHVLTGRQFLALWTSRSLSSPTNEPAKSEPDVLLPEQKPVSPNVSLPTTPKPSPKKKSSAIPTA